MKKMTLLAILFLSSYSLNAISSDQIHSAIQNGFSSNSHLKDSLSMTYGGKDISRPNVAIANKVNTNIQPITIG